MLSRAEEFRAQAQECEDKAKQADNPTFKAKYLDLAQKWRELAEQAERLGLF